jgi:hypothetical protein
MSVTRNISEWIMAGINLSADRIMLFGIESFWSYAKRRLQKFNGVPALPALDAVCYSRAFGFVPNSRIEGIHRSDQTEPSAYSMRVIRA